VHPFVPIPSIHLLIHLYPSVISSRHKKVHIRMITQIDSVRKRWHEKFGRSPTEEDVERMFENFVPMQLACLEEYSGMITGRSQ
jgi:hypothetical protein